MFLLNLLIILIILSSVVTAATLKGSIYNSQLELEKDVLIEINTTPQQQYLAKDGNYEFELNLGKYQLTARKGEIEIMEEVKIVKEGSFLFDIFLLSSLAEETELWQNSEEDLFNGEMESEPDEDSNNEEIEWWRWAIGIIVVLFSLQRIYRARKKYGSLQIFRKRIKKESKKTLEQHKAELEKEPGYIEKAIEIIKKHDGRISQKGLRKEMLYLSEAKVSLIVTELEHKGKVEKVKKGRGNVIILK